MHTRVVVAGAGDGAVVVVVADGVVMILSENKVSGVSILGFIICSSGGDADRGREIEKKRVD
jgi:hypothetical protein